MKVRQFKAMRLNYVGNVKDTSVSVEDIKIAIKTWRKQLRQMVSIA